MRLALTLIVVLLVVVTLASFAYNLVTNRRYRSAQALYAGPFVRVEKTQLAYRRWGSHGTPIVLLSGFAETSWVWHTLARSLARSYRVYALDLPPFGFSERRGPYTLSHWEQLTRGFIRHFRLKKPIVVGHSLGAAVAVAVGLRYPRTTGGVVLLDGDALPGGGPGWLAHLLVPPWYTSVFRIATSSDWIVRRIIARAWPHVRLSHPVLMQFEAPFRVRGTDSAFRTLLSYGIQGLPAADLEHLETRRLVVWGAQDSVDRVSAGRHTARLLHTRFVLIPAAGHLSMLENPAAVAATIMHFAAGAPTRH